MTSGGCGAVMISARQAKKEVNMCGCRLIDWETGIGQEQGKEKNEEEK